MELFYQLCSFLTRVSILSLLLYLVLGRLSGRDGPFGAHLNLVLYSFGPAFFGVFLYDAIIYRGFLDPLASLPSVHVFDVRELLPVTSLPRGERPLKWVKSFPGTDLINIRVFPANRVLFPVSPQAHRDIHNTHAQDFQKPSSGRDYLSSILGYGLILSEGAAHDHQRKIITPSFRLQNIRSLQPLIAEKTNLMLRGIRAEMEAKGSIEVSAWASRLTMDIIGPTLMSRDFQSLLTHESALESAFAETIAPSAGQTVLFGLSMLLPQWIVRNLTVSTNRMLNKNMGFVRETCGNILNEKLSSLKGQSNDDEEGTSDILGSIISRGEFSQKELVDQMMTFLAAGHETTASSISWAVHLLTLPEYQHYQGLLRKEVQDAMSDIPPEPNGDGGTMPYARLESLPYLNGICQEVLRLYPPVPTTARKAIRDTTVARMKVPRNTMAVLFPWAINRNPEFWGPEAASMIPDRWIDVLPDGTQRPNKHGGAASNMCDQTFLHGNRACIGRDLAKSELRYALAALFTQFRVCRLPGDDGDVVPAGALTIKPAGGMHVSVHAYDDEQNSVG